MPAKILTVDDSSAEMTAIHSMLSEYDVLTAHSCSEAIALLELNAEINIVIIDMDMREPDIFLLLSKLSHSGRDNKYRVLILTDSNELDKEACGLRMGASDYIRKPVTADSLRARINIQLQIISMWMELSKNKDIEGALIESERSKFVLLSNLPGMAYRCRFDKAWTMLFVSEGCCELTGYTSEDLLNNKALSFNDLIVPECREKLWEKWCDTLEQKKQFRDEYEIITASGARKWVLEIGQGIFNETGSIEALEGIIIDISDRREKELKLTQLSETDKLTGLYNRLYFENFLQKDTTAERNRPKALILMNLTRINSISTTYGYNYSERVIKNVASKLSALTNENRVLFRISYERFAFYLKSYDDMDSIKSFVKEICGSLGKVHIMYTIGCNIGIVEFTDTDADTLIKCASAVADKTGNGHSFEYRFSDEKLEAEELRNAQIIESLSNIINNFGFDYIYLQYQPILNLKTSRTEGLEALVRLNSEKLGLVSPSEFIPLAEETQIIVPLGKLIMNMACKFKKRLDDLGFGDVTVSINISATQIVRDAFLKDYSGIMREHQVDPSFFGFEITESVFTGDYNLINEKLGFFLNMGMKVAVDDFGTGYSSLSRGREMNVNCLKIDKSFIEKLLYIKPENSITGDIISIGHKLGHSVIAEGVEDEKQKSILIEHNCDMIQGYLYSKPLNEDDTIEFLTADS